MKSTGDMMISQKSQIILVEFKGHGKLMMNLMDSVQKLQKHRSETRVLVRIRKVATVIEAMTNRQPFFLNENAEAFNGSIIGIQTQQGQ